MTLNNGRLRVWHHRNPSESILNLVRPTSRSFQKRRTPSKQAGDEGIAGYQQLGRWRGRKPKQGSWPSPMSHSM